jgi:hypothetical protein
MLRQRIESALLIGWCLVLASCGGFGAFTVAINLEFAAEWAAIFGSIIFTCIVSLCDSWLANKI